MTGNATTPLVSVVMAAYNAQDFVAEALQSVLGQTIHDIEVIAVNDGSTDNTSQALDSFRDPRLKIINQVNSGQTIAKNRGIREATGRYVGFCDADDRWHPQKLEKQLPVFERSNRIAVVYSGESTIDMAGNPQEDSIEPSFRGCVLDQLFVDNFVPFGSALVRRDRLVEVGAFDESLRMGIDWDLWLRLAAVYEFDYVDEHLSIYRKWLGQMSTNWRGRYESAFRIMSKFQKANPGRIGSTVRRRAYANTYTNRGRARAGTEPLAGLADGIHGLVLDPAAKHSWKSVLRIAWAGLTMPIRHSAALGDP